MGDRRANIMGALARLHRSSLWRLIAVSDLYQSAPVAAYGNSFYNANCAVRSRLSPLQLLRELKRIERDAGRRPTFTNGPRVLDIDILLYGQRRLDGAHLQLPHPRIHERDFVILPAKEICCALQGVVYDQVASWAPTYSALLIRLWIKDRERRKLCRKR